ncbi:hypothetical protein OGAPHI_006596 [Ogataea philodendri]|uniref:Uncharacterized protein n=1 Tax=Ogataea philodendri TaxID=1378263 RepID=A0A9P8T0I0_9ASCO|nr:uncharacterized protein OGAPHI_006596 [Ogataea philodendri]KAH3661189.1 hypothetical protein OGAPHI_006596 [Ogataea philodendri]
MDPMPFKVAKQATPSKVSSINELEKNCEYSAACVADVARTLNARNITTQHTNMSTNTIPRLRTLMRLVSRASSGSLNVVMNSIRLGIRYVSRNTSTIKVNAQSILRETELPNLTISNRTRSMICNEKDTETLNNTLVVRFSTRSMEVSTLSPSNGFNVVSSGCDPRTTGF